MGKLAIIIWISVGVLLVLMASLIPPIFFSKSWWWFGGTLISLAVLALLGGGIFLIVRMWNKRHIAEEKPKDKKITDKEASDLVKNILLMEYADHFTSYEEKTTHEGTAGKPRTPVFHKFGQSYHGNYYYFMINMADPNKG